MKIRVFCGGVGLVALLVSIGVGQQPAAETPVSHASIQKSVKRVPYKQVGDVELALHVFEPRQEASEKSPRPAIVFFFGGGWTGGSPSQFYRQAWYLSQRGMVAICAEYRIKSKHQTTPRECVEDGLSAIRFVRSQADRWNIDPERIAGAGGSAGGHVAAATATVRGMEAAGENSEVSPRPNALVLFNPVLDNGPGGWGHDRVKDYWQQISPLHNVAPGIPPTIFFLGDQDKLIPVSVAEQFQKKVQAAKGRCDTVIYADQGHGFFNRGDSFLKTLQATDKFLVSLGYLTGPDQVEAKLKHLTQPGKK